MDLPLPILVAIVLAAGVWALVLVLRLPMLHACLASLLVVSCFGAAFKRWDIGPLNISADRLLLPALVPFFLLKQLLTRQPRFCFDRTDAVLAGLLGVLAISVTTHPLPPKSEASPTPAFLFLTSYFIPALVYWIVRLRAPCPRDIRVVCGFFVVFGIYLACTAVFEELRVTTLIFPRYILKERLYYAGRSVGPFLSAPVLGTWLTVAAVSAVLLKAHVRPLTGKLLLASLPLLAVGEFLTKTRSAWMGFLLAVPLAMYLTGTRLQRRLLLLGGTWVVFFAALFWGERIASPDRGEARAIVAYSTNQRLALLQRSVALFVRRPVFGWGFRHFEHVSRVEGAGGPLQLVSNDAAKGLASHNLLLRVVVETGAVGTIFLLLVFWYWTHRSCQAIARLENGALQRDMAILFLCGLIAYWSEAMFHDVTFMMHENLLIWFLAGCMGTWRPAAASAETARTAVPPRGVKLRHVHAYPAMANPA